MGWNLQERRGQLPRPDKPQGTWWTFPVDGSSWVRGGQCVVHQQWWGRANGVAGQLRQPQAPSSGAEATNWTDPARAAGLRDRSWKNCPHPVQLPCVADDTFPSSAGANHLDPVIEPLLAAIREEDTNSPSSREFSSSAQRRRGAVPAYVHGSVRRAYEFQTRYGSSEELMRRLARYPAAFASLISAPVTGWLLISLLHANHDGSAVETVALFFVLPTGVAWLIARLGGFRGASALGLAITSALLAGATLIVALVLLARGLREQAPRTGVARAATDTLRREPADRKSPKRGQNAANPSAIFAVSHS